MKKIIEVKHVPEIIQNLKKRNKTIVLTGGCFDILHAGHMIFLRKAKKLADVLIVLLESDNNIRKIKGEKRPINIQKYRAIMLSSISCVDLVFTLPETMTNNDYDKLVKVITPDIIATTKGDPNIVHKQRQARLINAELKQIVKRIPLKSSTRLAKFI